jgi:hypothetical protein
VAELNACIPYAGVSAGARLEDPVLTVLLSLLPLEPPAGAKPPPPTTREAIRTINVLHCLQRLATSMSVATSVLQTPGVSTSRAPTIPSSGCTDFKSGFDRQILKQICVMLSKG